MWTFKQIYASMHKVTNRQSEMRRALNKTCNKTISAAFDKQWGGVVKKCPPG